MWDLWEALGSLWFFLLRERDDTVAAPLCVEIVTTEDTEDRRGTRRRKRGKFEGEAFEVDDAQTSTVVEFDAEFVVR